MQLARDLFAIANVLVTFVVFCLGPLPGAVHPLSGCLPLALHDTIVAQCSQRIERRTMLKILFFVYVTFCLNMRIIDN